MAGIHRLTSAEVANAKLRGKSVRTLCDGGGLYLRIRREKSGEISTVWFFRFKTGATVKTKSGKQRQDERWHGIGPLHSVTMAQAREIAANLRMKRKQGIDPIEVVRTEAAAKAAEKARLVTFKQCAEAFIAAHEASWKNKVHKQQWKNTLKTYAYPVFGDVAVGAIDDTMVMKVLEPLWHKRPETAVRVRGRIEQILDWAKVKRYRTGDNPARWKGHLDHLLPARNKVRKVKHHPALPFDEIPAFLAQLRGMEGQSPWALEFLILTAARTSEVTGALWTEINVKSNAWIIPPERMKGGEEHRVPLTPQMLELLSPSAKYLFPSEDGGELSNMAMLMLLRRMNREDLTVHGFRSSFRDWAAECTNFPNHVVEMALAHKISDAVEAAYRRGDLFEKRRRLMAAWCEFCTKPVVVRPEPATVTSFPSFLRKVVGK